MVRSKASKRKNLGGDGADAAAPDKRPRQGDATSDKPPRRGEATSKANPADKEDDGLDPRRVYVSRLPDAWASDDLKKAFEAFGEVRTASVMSDA
eukprot:CAMPEP_0119289126 /NCGR_PEP_ID=MMETSP1329-20130426/38485_1 /TAXON_ID=114041 /ORGANISM="Genus nov. species nov., Strain RCC1024" /LENGTH=94 /DNA_ID=CAMNT_0007289917 /DNA_START=161 /DNA_END=441 /DNA_ORIENTATION=+